MPSLFSGLNVALRALLAQQESIQVIEHNVANANTPGYRRQQAVLSTGVPTMLSIGYAPGAIGQLGTGVMVEQVKRFSLDFMDVRYRDQVSASKQWALERDSLQQVETSLSENSTNGVGALLDDFWNQWQALSNDPTNQTFRSALMDSSQKLVNAFNSRSTSLSNMRSDQNLSLVQHVQEVNELASQVAELNGEISHVLATNDQPNDQMDKRDIALDRLAELTGATSHKQENGEVIVSINGHVLVSGQQAYKLVTTNSVPTATVSWEDGQAFSPVTGELAGTLDVRDKVIPGLQKGLDDTAFALIKAVNAIHNPDPATVPPPSNPPYAAPGMDFFKDVGSSNGAAGTIQLNPNLKNSDILGASAVNPGDGTIAQLISNVRTQAQASLGNATINDYYTNQSAGLGLAIQNATSNATNHDLVASALSSQRDSFTGVNLDEEAASLVSAQKAYQAATRVFNAMDDMMDRIINGLGLVGR
ncbi:MAG TPA: flagellar hook-associated protein FlgK [Anaerolineaceae bacterium]|nr:flagellar hook-associated protein FlgK [Anaerolineaceae bacterium]